MRVLPRVDRASEEGRAKFVPAAAVTRTVRTLFGITGLKGCVGGLVKSGVKSHGSTVELRLKLSLGLRETEVSGTDGGAVKCVDIIRNTGGESGSLGLF
jgi:hypothetical protein